MATFFFGFGKECIFIVNPYRMLVTDSIKDEYLNKHLPYRVNCMLAHDLIMLRKTKPHYADIEYRCYGDSTVVEPIFEVSLVVSRALLNFLGITVNRAGQIRRYESKDDDMTMKELFPDRDYCPLDDPIIQSNQDALCAIMRLANKGVAHLTMVVSETQPHEHDVLPAARQAIYKLVFKHVPEVNRENIQWYKQVENIN